MPSETKLGGRDDESNGSDEQMDHPGKSRKGSARHPVGTTVAQLSRFTSRTRTISMTSQSAGNANIAWGAKGAMNKLLKLNHRDRTTLLHTPFMASLGPLAIERMLDVVNVVNYEARDLLFREREPARSFYCVLSGHVRLFRLSKDGRDANIRICCPGDVFAECLLAAGEVYHYNAQAVESVTVARFDLQRVRMLADEEKDVSKAIITSLSAHLLSSLDCIANDRLLTAQQRLAHYLLDQCPDDSQSASIRLPFQKSLLAGKLGLAPEALSRAFSTLRSAGVTVRGRVIEVADVNALKRL